MERGPAAAAESRPQTPEVERMDFRWRKPASQSRRQPIREPCGASSPPCGADTDFWTPFRSAKRRRPGNHGFGSRQRAGTGFDGRGLSWTGVADRPCHPPAVRENLPGNRARRAAGRLGTAPCARRPLPDPCADGQSGRAWISLSTDPPQPDPTRRWSAAWEATARAGGRPTPGAWISITILTPAGVRCTNRNARQVSAAQPPVSGEVQPPKANRKPERWWASAARCRFRHVVALHSQGEEIYWEYGPKTPERSRLMAEILASASGYTVAHPGRSRLGRRIQGLVHRGDGGARASPWNWAKAKIPSPFPISNPCIRKRGRCSCWP